VLIWSEQSLEDCPDRSRFKYGLIAEDVNEVYPDLVAHSADGQIETVKYHVLDSMLLNEVQKQYQHAQQQIRRSSSRTSRSGSWRLGWRRWRRC
jgi:hypothetical protein